MKLSTLIVASALTVCLLPVSSMAGEPVIFHASRVKILIDDIRFSDRYVADAGILAAKGYIENWSDAEAASFHTEDRQGVIQHLKIFAVPFVDNAGRIGATIIGGVIQSPDGRQLDEFITTISIPISIQGHAIPGIAKEEHAIADANITPIIRSFSTGNRADIWAYIIRNIAPKPADSGIAIKTAFESNGYSCSISPDWFPQKSIWYVATCSNGQ